MTLQQLQYVVALDAHRNFVLAAEACGVTQPTLSAMVQKLEDELNVQIFERSRKGVVPTSIGTKIIGQAKAAVREAHRLEEVVKEEIGSLTGRLHIGIAPTIAPILVPDLILHFSRLYPQVELQIDEMKSSALYEDLAKGNLDMVIATPPAAVEGLLEIPVYKERFLAYFSEECMNACAAAPAMMKDGLLSLEKMDLNHMWILQEGHCMNTGDFSFCMDRAGTCKGTASCPDNQTKAPVAPLEGRFAPQIESVSGNNRSVYQAGSIVTLIRIVDRNGGFTIIPEMHANLLPPAQQQNVHPLAEGDKASRTVSILVNPDFVRERLLNAVVDTLKLIVPARMLTPNVTRGPIRLL